MENWEAEDHEPLHKICGCSYTWGEGVQMCPMHEAAPELLAALEGPEESPQLTRVEYLDTLLDSIENNTLDADRAEDPDAVGTALSILRDLVTEGRAAIAKTKT